MILLDIWDKRTNEHFKFMRITDITENYWYKGIKNGVLCEGKLKDLKLRDIEYHSKKYNFIAVLSEKEYLLSQCIKFKEVLDIREPINIHAGLRSGIACYSDEDYLHKGILHSYMTKTIWSYFSVMLEAGIDFYRFEDDKLIVKLPVKGKYEFYRGIFTIKDKATLVKLLVMRR